MSCCTVLLLWRRNEDEAENAASKFAVQECDATKMPKESKAGYINILPLNRTMLLKHN